MIYFNNDFVYYVKHVDYAAFILHKLAHPHYALKKKYFIIILLTS